MRNIAISLCMLILIGFFAGAYAQGVDTARRALPPEIMADRYLLQAEQLELRKDYARALSLMAKAITLQKEHNFKLPDEFHFKYARVAFAADSINVAYDAVVEYLIAAGRKGELYKEALALSLEAEKELEAPEILVTDMCADKEQGAECWMELTSHPRCSVWSENLWNTVVWWSGSWSGTCSEKVAHGEGTLIWTRGDGEYSQSGRLRKGKFHGHWVERSKSGNESKGAYVDGTRHGLWVIQISINTKERGKYTYGKREGPWLKYYQGVSGEESCTSIAYREGEAVTSRDVDMSKCEGW